MVFKKVAGVEAKMRKPQYFQGSLGQGTQAEGQIVVHKVLSTQIPSHRIWVM